MTEQSRRSAHEHNAPWHQGYTLDLAYLFRRAKAVLRQVGGFVKLSGTVCVQDSHRPICDGKHGSILLPKLWPIIGKGQEWRFYTEGRCPTQRIVLPFLRNNSMFTKMRPLLAIPYEGQS
jgi:hypothetical protein